MIISWANVEARYYHACIFCIIVIYWKVLLLTLIVSKYVNWDFFNFGILYMNPYRLIVRFLWNNVMPYILFHKK